MQQPTHAPRACNSLLCLPLPLPRPFPPQVLSNAALRKRYDQSGCAALSDVNFMDSSAFYSALFGSEMFEHLVGELVIATVARCVCLWGGRVSYATLHLY